jgi:hypothetical protein
VIGFAAATSLFRAIVGERRTLCAARPADREALEDSGVLAGPLLVEETGQVLGMLKVEKAGFPAINLAAIQNFEVICRWIAKAYWKALLHQDGHLSQAFNVRTGILSHAFYEQQLLFLTRLASRLGFPLTALSVRLADGDLLHEPERAALAGILGGAVQQVLRGIDLAFEGEHPGQSFNILLVNTTAQQTRVAGRKLEQELRKRLAPTSLQARFSFRIRVIHQGAAEVSVAREAKSLAAIGKALTQSEAFRPSPELREVWRV